MIKAYFCYERNLSTLDLHPVIYHSEMPKHDRYNRVQVVELKDDDPTSIVELVVKYPPKKVEEADAQ